MTHNRSSHLFRSLTAARRQRIRDQTPGILAPAASRPHDAATRTRRRHFHNTSLVRNLEGFSVASSGAVDPPAGQPCSRRQRHAVKQSPDRPAKGQRWFHREWELTVGIEIHAQLEVERKLFSDAGSFVSDGPNSHVAVFDAALPGTQPTLQPHVLVPALRAALALGCEIRHVSHFDRKHYFYRDQPNGYQITQHREPFARDGQVVLHAHDGIADEDGNQAVIGIGHVQLEQDTAKSIQEPPSAYLLDFNRVSQPLIEIVSLPDMHHPATAAAFVRKVQWILKSVNACTVGMELGGLRADVNVSVRRRPGSDTSDGPILPPEALGRRTEIKNLSSFKAVEEAIEAERDRQIVVLEAGGTILGETRGWTLGAADTTKLRDKEGEVDYRYLPDPDIPPLVISPELVDHVRTTLPMLPDEQLRLLTDRDDSNLSWKDAKTLMLLDDGARLDYFQSVRSLVHDRLVQAGVGDQFSRPSVGRSVGNWVLHELGGLLAGAERTWEQNLVPAATLADIVALLHERKITGKTAKFLLSSVFQGEKRPIAEVVDEQRLLLRPMSPEEYETLAHEVFQNNHSAVQKALATKKSSKIHFFVGQMIRRGEEGRVEAKRAEATVRELLKL